MANKHILSDDEDDVDVHTSSSGKRQRRDDEDSDRASPVPQPVKKAQKHAQDDAMDEDEDSDELEDEEDDAEDEEEARLNLAEIARSMKAGAKRVAESGVIRQVDLQNFMCHSNTTVNFGPQVNFLVGVNGSGKSAVLTGITMALGGNAKATNRGQKGGDLIMEGKSSARCSVTLANVGEDAYQPEVFGKQITIERTLNKAGGGAYKIKNAESKTVDTKKALLDAILDHFNIQVDNPMTVLTQDQSRQFLASSSSKDKYNFFLRGTQLAQLTDEYEQIRSNTETMDEVLARKRETIPELKAAYRNAKDRAKTAQLAVDQQKNLDALQDQLAWAFVDESEKQIAFGADKIAEEKQKLAEHEADMQKLEDELGVHDGKIADLREAEAEARAIIEEKMPRRDELKDMIKADRDRAVKRKDAERQMNSTLEHLRATIDEFDRQIAEEERKLSRDIEAERRPLRENIAKANDEITRLTEQISTARRTMDELEAKRTEDGAQYESVKEHLGRAQNSIREIESRIEAARRSQKNSLAAYGEKMPRFLQSIQSERWREKPVGPVGVHVKLNDPMYSRALESFFGPSLNAFIVTNLDDQRTLKRLHRAANLDHNVPILTAAFDPNFDCSQGEPDPNILTVLRACTIDHELVRQALVNSNHIENSALAPTRPDGDVLLRTNPRNCRVAYSADCFAVRNNQGRSSSAPMPPWKGLPRLNRDVEGAIRAFGQDLDEKKREMQRILADKDRIHQRCVQWERDIRSAETDERNAQKQMVTLNRRIADWDAKLQEEQPNNIAALQENKRETEQERENALAQFKAGMENLNASPENQNAQATVDELRGLEEQLKKKDKLIQQIQKHVIDAQGAATDIRARLDKIEKARKSLEVAIEQHEGQLEAAKKDCESRIEQASKICPRPTVEKAKDRRKLEKEINSIKAALKKRERDQGATLEEILQELENRKKAAHEAVKSTNEIASLIKALSAAYDARVSRWTDFREHIAARARQMFSHHLTSRGFTGKLKFQHEKCTLDILIQTEADAGKVKARQKDTKSLSGGEKSFSTVCLLLTMWESVGCPLRCLDEFDVFMDAVNRRIAMKMMVETAAAADQTQFILITPQDMGSLSHVGDEVKIVKLADPSRASGALAHGR